MARHIYVHNPFCAGKCPYCDFYSITDKSFIELFYNAALREVRLTGEIITSDTGANTGIEKNSKVTVKTEDGEYAGDCVFVLRPTVAPATLLPGLETDGAAIRHDEKLRTSIPRVCVAGDAAGAPLQVAKAVGDGCVAAYSLVEDLKALNG